MNFNEKKCFMKERIKKLYLNKEDVRPWVIGFSGGKDSTALTQIVFETIMEIPKIERNRKVFIISSDTMIENPMIIKYIDNCLEKLSSASIKLELPFEVSKVHPEMQDSFWVNFLGKGYPAPIQNFRWCTDRLKIKPANKFITRKVSEYGEVIMLLGVRKGESNSRDRVLKSHEVDGKILKNHTTLSNAYIFAPIEEFTTDDVWEYLITNYITPWDTDNRVLLQLYEDSTQTGECPLIVDKDTPSCGNSRFGCWLCTVVKEDKSLIGFLKTAIRNGDEEVQNLLTGLLTFRNKIKNDRDNREYREKKRRDGKVYYLEKENENGEKEQVIGLGSYKLKYRKEVLEELLFLERELNYKLISISELEKIQELWTKEEGDLSNSVFEIYKKVYNNRLEEKIISKNSYWTSEDKNLLEELCIEIGVDFAVIEKLLGVELKYYGYKQRSGIYNAIDKILNQDWIHDENYSEAKKK
ncbi:MAG: DNA phosphorothioation system sulfurtransferase DndC [Fusobacteriaceae bacterium]